jgi:pSer/pThr/pTyr-binding forkhead associated (FHA) protein
MQTSFTNPEPGVEPIPGYCLSQRLGRGGYGEVWRAYAPGGFQVALKFVPLQNACGAVELRALDLIRDIRHPNLLVTFASWQIEGWLIIAMELADRTLMDRLREVRDQGQIGIPRDELLDYFQEAARGIDFLNEPRMMPGGTQRFAVQHRDIKPQNILLVGNGVKVADFGLARLMSQVETGHSGGMTPTYAAPEFFRGQTASTSDQYCFAVTYCKARGGCTPFEGTLSEIMAGHLNQAPDLRMIPPAEQQVVARALSKEPKDRWPSCRAFVDALLDCDNVPHVKDQTPVSTISYPIPATSSHAPVLPVEPLPSAAPAPAPAITEAALAPLMALQPLIEANRPYTRTWTIGRDAGCDLVVQQSAVSSQHCRLSATDQGYVLEDLSSSNGTFVNGHRIQTAVHVVPTDEITLGQTVPMPWPGAAPTPVDTQVVTIGREPDNDVVLDFTTVSSHHARIVFKNGVAYIEDLGSTNGVAIGLPTAKISQAALHADDVVYFGSVPVPASQLLKGKARQADTHTIHFRGQPLVLGRDAGCDLIIDLPTISGRHARIWQEDHRILIEDLGSTNGTFVNGERIHLSAAVKPRDRIGLGSQVLELRVS